MDGFAAAYAAWKQLGNDATYIPFKPHQRVHERDVFQKHVVFVDVAPDRSQWPEMERMMIQSLKILDHHETSLKEWEDTSYMTFSATKSGAWLAWDFFHPESRVPRLITYVSDRDNWFRSLPRVDDLMASLWMTPFYTKHGVLNFKEWDEIVRDIDTDDGFEEYCKRGVPVREVMDRHITISTSKAFPIVLEGVPMWTINDPTPHRSMAADILLQKPFLDGEMPGAVLIWFYHAPSKAFACSLRSRPGSEVDVGLLAEKFGGGGRRNTSAFSWSGDIRDLLHVTPE